MTTAGPGNDSRLVEAIAPGAAAHPGLSGIYALPGAAQGRGPPVRTACDGATRRARRGLGAGARQFRREPARQDLRHGRRPRIAYEVRLGDDDGLQWVERTDSGERIHATEPDTGLSMRATVRIRSWLPIDHLL